VNEWPKKVRVPLPGPAIGKEICDLLGFDSYVAMAAQIDAIAITFTVDQDGRILVASLWRGREEAGT